MKIFTNQFFLTFATSLFIIGIYLSINVGITHDEFHDYYVWEANKNLIFNPTNKPFFQLLSVL